MTMDENNGLHWMASFIRRHLIPIIHSLLASLLFALSQVENLSDRAPSWLIGISSWIRWDWVSFFALGYACGWLIKSGLLRRKEDVEQRSLQLGLKLSRLMSDVQGFSKERTKFAGDTLGDSMRMASLQYSGQLNAISASARKLGLLPPANIPDAAQRMVAFITYANQLSPLLEAGHIQEARVMSKDLDGECRRSGAFDHLDLS